MRRRAIERGGAAAPSMVSMVSMVSMWAAMAVIATIATIATGTTAAALQQAPAARRADADGSPIKCWWRTDKTAIHIGERFTLVLTCGVMENARFTVVPDLNSLAPTAVQMSPFEVVGGSRHEGIAAPPWRYVQFEYTTRLLGEGFFGQEVDIPSLIVSYNIRASGADAGEGRDERYTLPPLPMRVLSLTTKRTADIRDGSGDTFADIERRLFRATGELVASGILFGFAVVLVGIAAVRSIGQYRSRSPVKKVTLLSARTLLGASARGLARVKAQVAREGWTPELASQTLAVLRVAGAAALGRPVAQTVVDGKATEREGQLLLGRGLLRRRPTLLSAPTSPDAMARALDGRTPGAQRQVALDQIREGLIAFGASRYQPEGALDRTALDAALEQAAAAVSRLRILSYWPTRLTGATAPTGTPTGTWTH